MSPLNLALTFIVSIPKSTDKIKCNDSDDISTKSFELFKLITFKPLCHEKLIILLRSKI